MHWPLGRVAFPQFHGARFAARHWLFVWRGLRACRLAAGPVRQIVVAPTPAVRDFLLFQEPRVARATAGAASDNSGAGAVVQQELRRRAGRRYHRPSWCANHRGRTETAADARP